MWLAGIVMVGTLGAPSASALSRNRWACYTSDMSSELATRRQIVVMFLIGLSFLVIEWIFELPNPVEFGLTVVGVTLIINPLFSNWLVKRRAAKATLE